MALRLQYYGNTLVNCLVGMDKSFINFQPNAGRRTDFRDKNRELFPGELFSGEELLPEKSVLG